MMDAGHGNKDGHISSIGLQRLKLVRLLQFILCLVTFHVIVISTVQCQRGATTGFKHLTVDEGLSFSTVHTIIEDRLGMIWVGTRFGLNRFDGYEFQVFLPEEGNPHSIGHQSVVHLWEDQLGNVWIGHINGGISIYDRNEEKFRRFPDDRNSDLNWNDLTIRKFFQDSKGNLWIGTNGSGVVVFDSSLTQTAHLSTWTFETKHTLTNDFVFDILEDSNGRVWIATAGTGLNYYDPRTDETSVVEGDSETRMDGFGKSLVLDSSGKLWVGTAGDGLYLVDPDEMDILEHITASPNGLSHDMITDLEMDANRVLWIATDGGGISSFSTVDSVWSRYRYEPEYLNSLNTDAVYDLMIDHNENLWIGTFNGGINFHASMKSPFSFNRRYADERSEGLRSGLCLRETEDGRVWMGTDGGGLFEIDIDAENREVSLDAFETKSGRRISESVITSLEVTPTGNFWVGTFARGLHFVDADLGKVRSFRSDASDPKSLAHNNVWDLELGSNGDLWIGTLGGGISLLRDGAVDFENYQSSDNANSIAGNQVVDILLDEDRGNLWIATEDQGLSCIHLDKRPFLVSNFRIPEGLNSDDLRCLMLSSDGDLWIGTENAGINVYDHRSGAFNSIDRSDGLPSRMINSMVEDELGYIWIGTQAGIVRWDRTDSVALDVGVESNLGNNQYNPGAAIRLGNGMLIFGTTNGYSVLDPNHVESRSEPPNLVYTGLSLSNQRVAIGEHDGRNILSGPLNDSSTVIQLSYRDKGISFTFAATEYSRPDKIQYAYRLLDFDTSWHYVNADQRSAAFSRLPGGTYTLQVKASNGEGLLSEQPRSLRIEVPPPFWETPLFLVLMFALVVAIVVIVNRILFRRQRAEFARKALESEQEILRLRNDNLKKDITNKQSQLNASVLQVAHKNEILNTIKSELSEIQSSSDQSTSKSLRKTLRHINSELSQGDYWDQFQLVFDQTFQDFRKLIEERHPSLSSNDQRLCCFVKMQLNNREIASILNVTVNGVEQAKYRLKKKMGLPKSDSLNTYIQSLRQD